MSRNIRKFKAVRRQETRNGAIDLESGQMMMAEGSCLLVYFKKKV